MVASFSQIQAEILELVQQNIAVLKNLEKVVSENKEAQLLLSDILLELSTLNSLIISEDFAGYVQEKISEESRKYRHDLLGKLSNSNFSIEFLKMRFPNLFKNSHDNLMTVLTQNKDIYKLFTRLFQV